MMVGDCDFLKTGWIDEREEVFGGKKVCPTSVTIRLLLLLHLFLTLYRHCRGHYQSRTLGHGSQVSQGNPGQLSRYQVVSFNYYSYS